MPLLLPLGCTNQRLLLHSIVASWTLAPILAFGKEMQLKTLQQGATNYFLRPPSTPNHFHSLQHWSHPDKAITWSPTPNAISYQLEGWPTFHQEPATGHKVETSWLIVGDKHRLNWSKTHFLCSVLAQRCLVLTVVTLNNLEKLLQHQSYQNVLFLTMTL